MNRRFQSSDEKMKNTASVAPVMPSAPEPKRKPDRIIQKIYIQQPKPGEFYGIPKLALIIISGNALLWLCGFVTIWIAGHTSVLDIAGGIIFFAAAFLIWLAIQMLIYKMYWWLLALSASLTSLALIYFYIMLLSGAAALNQIQLPRLSF